MRLQLRLNGDCVRYSRGHKISAMIELDAPKPRLSRREDEIARLITDGLTNAEIAARLFIATRTAETHVQHILNKLGFRRRAQIAAWKALETARHRFAQEIRSSDDALKRRAG